MNKAAGYIVRLSADREFIFDHNEHEGFAEPVSDFAHSRNIPLICFIIDSTGNIAHIALGRRGYRAGTGLRRLNLYQVFTLGNKIPISTICELAPNRVAKKIEEKIINGGLLPPKSFEALIKIVSELSNEASLMLAQYSEARIRRIKNLPSSVKAVLAEQKEAMATALTIAGIDRSELLGWDLNDNDKVSSFLDGIEKVRLREDPMVINDLTNLPGYEILKQTPHNSIVFENDKTKLTVVLANRLPLEEQLGVDLIYFNETFSCFLMIQYKAMEEESGDVVYRFPNAQLTKELDRMNSALSELAKCSANNEADGYRLSENPFFLKICPRIIFNPDNIGLVKGMYLPLEYWNLISQHPSMVGPKGGKRLSYRNVRRYFDNTEFVSLASGGWVGTNIQQSSVLQDAIRSTLESGRAVVFAVNVEINSRHRVDS